MTKEIILSLLFCVGASLNLYGVIFCICYLGQVRTRLVGIKVRTFGPLS